MSHLWSRIAFASVALILLYGMHRYVWARLVRDARLSRGRRIAATVAIALLGLSLPAAFYLSRRAIGEGKIGLTLEAYLWLGFLFYCVLLLASIDLVRAVVFLSKRVRQWGSRERDARAAAGPDSSAKPDGRPVPDASPAIDAPAVPERRVFLARAIAGTAALSSGAIAIGGYRSAMGDITTPEIPVRLARLPRELSGYRIVQLTDLHLGPTLAGRFLEACVEKANAERPDLVVITGDMVDGRVATLGPALAPLSKLTARHGVVFVTGNHEYYAGAEEWIEFLRARGIRVPMNERMEIGDEVRLSLPDDGSSSVSGTRSSSRPSFDLAGIPDLHAGSYSAAQAPDLARALAGRDPERELVLLAHQPAQIAMAEGKGVGLQISGHTHGGQMWPFGALVALVQPYVAGFHRHPDGTQIYVSRGAGFWGPPMRVANPAEIASIVLVAD
jgi:predicted MPP superfamily phosphohydrolase